MQVARKLHARADFIHRNRGKNKGVFGAVARVATQPCARTSGEARARLLTFIMCFCSAHPRAARQYARYACALNRALSTHCKRSHAGCRRSLRVWLLTQSRASGAASGLPTVRSVLIDSPRASLPSPPPHSAAPCQRIAPGANRKRLSNLPSAADQMTRRAWRRRRRSSTPCSPPSKASRGTRQCSASSAAAASTSRRAATPHPDASRLSPRRHASHGLAPTHAQVITSLSADDFGAWEAAGFAPEADFLAKLNGINGISSVETQTFTLMPQ